MKAEKGLLLGGRYRLDELLATGGMGEVWTGHDESVGRVVAVKVLREEFTGNQEFLRRLRTEARNSSALSHQNIAQMYDYGEQNGTGFLVMELVPGEPLADLLDRKPVLPPEELLPILSATARGLQHAHQASVVHRDVKPGNILLQPSVPGEPPLVKITDFGVSLAANQAPMTATGMVMGTAQYLSPEQAIGKPATGRSDLYALGVIAYEATAGKRPFTGKSPVDIAIAHVNDPPPPLPPGTDPRLAGVIMRLLDKEPEGRYADAGELADALDRLSTELASGSAAPALPARAANLPVEPSHASRLSRGERAAKAAEKAAAKSAVVEPDVVVVPGAALPPKRRSARRQFGARPIAAPPVAPVAQPPIAQPPAAQPSYAPAPAGQPPVAQPAVLPPPVLPPPVAQSRLAPPPAIQPTANQHPGVQPPRAVGAPPQRSVTQGAAANLTPQPVLVSRKDIVGQRTPPPPQPFPRIAVLLIAVLAVIVLFVVIHALVGGNSSASAYTVTSLVWFGGLSREGNLRG